jgi:hypothetical protein
MAMTPGEIYIDLLKQGFMRPLKVKRPKKERPIVACDKCQDWHPEGKHRKR